MDQDIAVRLMMIEIKQEIDLIEEHENLMKKYLHYMFGVGFDAGRKDVYARYSKKKTPIIQRDENNNRIAQYESIAQAARAANTCTSVIFEALKKHWKTKAGHYWEKVVY
jgi:hypothetical protein